MAQRSGVVSLDEETSTSTTYDNHAIATVNDHVVRISTMTHAYPWHCHPDSDETFLVIEGTLELELAEGAIRLEKGDLFTVQKGLTHRSRPIGERSVNLTFESAFSTTVMSDAP